MGGLKEKICNECDDVAPTMGVVESSNVALKSIVDNAKINLKSFFKYYSYPVSIHTRR